MNIFERYLNFIRVAYTQARDAKKENPKGKVEEIYGLKVFVPKES